MMTLARDCLDPALTHATRRLMQRTMSPLTGITQGLGVFLGNRTEPRVVVAGAELTGMHVIQGRNAPGRSMHIGGCGASFKEALMPALAEALERYAQLWAGMSPRKTDRFLSHQALRRADLAGVALEKLTMFTPQQYATAGFPFQQPAPDAPMTWSRGLSLISGRPLYAPAQQLFLGYTPRLADGERWISPAVTTGTAVHTTPLAAFRNAMLELVQLDSAMGHWLGRTSPVRIAPDARVGRLEHAMAGFFRQGVGARPRFYWLRNPDLRHFTIACVLHDPHQAPAAVVGLGSDLRLEAAMYKALVESCGVYQLAKLVMLQEHDLNGGAAASIDTSTVYDLDMNVVYYARRDNAHALLARFDACERCGAAQLPADPAEPVGPDIGRLVHDFRTTGKELLYFDLTTPDLKQVGFYATRVWSPDTISLSLPSAPVHGHHRLQAYGGANGDSSIHPYP